MALKYAFSVAFGAALSNALNAVPVINTIYGPITGITTGTGYAYLGVPYASAQRWGAPLPPPKWASVFNASTYGAGCIQFQESTILTDSEDCLTVNVFVPTVQSEGNPMIVWIHGGGFIGGSGSGDQSFYANGTGAIVVSINYRLGSLGYFTLPGMAPAFPTPTDPSVACSNVGLLDQQAALSWAHANAAAFGANAANIVVTGQSAGGSSVLFQLTLPGSYGLYRAAIPQSPGSPVNVLSSGQATASAIAQQLNCDAGAGYAAQLACLRALPASSIQNAAIKVAQTSTLPLTLGPVVDGALVTAAPADAILAGNYNTDAVVVVTETLFEGDSLLAGFIKSVVLNASQAAQSLSQFSIQVGWNKSTTDAIGRLYAPLAARDGFFNGSSRLWGDGLISCAAAWAALGASQHSKYPVHRLLFNATLTQSGGGQPAGRATHGSDLPFFFNPASYFTPLEAAVQVDLHRWVTNLAVTGDVNNGPAGPGTITWPAFTPGTSTLMVVNELREYTFIPEWQEEFCASWLALLP